MKYGSIIYICLLDLNLMAYDVTILYKKTSYTCIILIINPKFRKTNYNIDVIHLNWKLKLIRIIYFT